MCVLLKILEILFTYGAGALSLKPGVGGHCIAVDLWFIVDSAPTEARLIRAGAAREVNDGKPEFVLEKIRKVAEAFK